MIKYYDMLRSQIYGLVHAIVQPSLLALTIFSCVISSINADDIESARTRALDRHTELAMQHQRDEQLAAALRQWRIVDAIDKSNSAASRQIRALKSQIRSKTKRLLAEAGSAMENADRKRAKRLYLAVLAIDANNQFARDSVLLLESGEKIIALTKNSEPRSFKPISAKPTVSIEPSPPVPVETISITRKKPTVVPESEVETRESDESSSVNPDTSSSESMTEAENLAERHFQQGMALFLSDRAAAIIQFERSLSLNPDHVLARRYRSTALKLQKY